MDVWLWVAISIMTVLALLFVYAATEQKKLRIRNLVTTFVIVVSTVATWMAVKQELPMPQEVAKLEQTKKDLMLDIQDSLKADPNQSDVWFQLGNIYLSRGEFSAALTSFDYSLRLANTKSANQYAAKATALYYVQSQQLSEEVRALLDKSLAKDEFNETALTLIASDHFISFRYPEAILAWTKILDSNRQGIDRVELIHSINRAKQMIR